MALVAGGLFAGLVLWPSARGPAIPLRRALPFSLADVRAGHPNAVVVASPGHAVVVNFFAAWCDPCHAELPLLADLARRRGGAVQVIGVDMKDNADLARQLLSDAHVGYPAGYDPDRAVSQAWRVDGLPVTVFVAPDGTVVDYHRGQLQVADLTRRVDRLVRRATAPGGTGA